MKILPSPLWSVTATCCMVDVTEPNGASDEDIGDLHFPEDSAHPRRPSPQATLRKFYLDSSASSQGYTSTLRVESSLENPGSHKITHTACDISSGITQTVHEETVQAETLRTTMSIQ